MKKLIIFKILMLMIALSCHSQVSTQTSSNGSYSIWNSSTNSYSPATFFDFDPPVKIILEEGTVTIAKTVYKLGKILLKTKDENSSQVIWEAINTKKVKCKIKMVNHFNDDSIVIYAIYPSKIYGYLIDDN